MQEAWAQGPSYGYGQSNTPDLGQTTLPNYAPPSYFGTNPVQTAGSYGAYTPTQQFSQSQLNQNVNQSNSSMPSYLQIPNNYGYTQYQQGVNAYLGQQVAPAISQLQSTAQQNGMQNSTFAGAQAANLQADGLFYADQAGQQWENNSVNNLLNERASYNSAPTQNYQDYYNQSAGAANQYTNNQGQFNYNLGQLQNGYNNSTVSNNQNLGNFYNSGANMVNQNSQNLYSGNTARGNYINGMGTAAGAIQGGAGLASGAISNIWNNIAGP